MKPISNERNEKVAHFAKVIRPFLKKYSNDVKAARKWAERQGRRRDRPWMGFIVAFATNGGVRHWIKQVGPTQERYAWNAIVRLSARQRRERLIEATNPRRRWKWNKKKKELWYPKKLETCFKEFKKAGGPKGIRKQYRAKKPGAERIAYLKKFEGIGDKYARDIPMDSYDALFRNYIALDWRLKKLLLFAFPKRLNYNDGEEFYRQVAHKLKIDCWTLDRTLFHGYKEINRKFEQASKR